MITLTQMRYFYEVCRWQNITKAAEHLHVSQPTISVAMRTLEEETGLNLFHREGRKLVMTSEGSKLLSKVNHILNQMDQLETEIQDMAHNRNHIRMALPLQIGTRFLPRILGEFRIAHPKIKLEVIESGGISALQMVEDEKLDIALTNYTTGFSQKLVYQKLYDCELNANQISSTCLRISIPSRISWNRASARRFWPVRPCCPEKTSWPFLSRSRFISIRVSSRKKAASSMRTNGCSSTI